MNTVVEKINPDIAKEYLSHNAHNRIIKKSTVDAYCRDMINGVFETTHQGIAFYDDGSLADGQHRLFAVIKSGCEVRMLVTRGMSPDVAHAIDRGVTRSVGDTIKIGNNVSGDTSKQRVVIQNRKVISMISQMIDCNVSRGLKLSTNDINNLSDVFVEHMIHMYDNVISKSGKIIKPSAPMLAAGMSALICGVDIDSISKFYDVFTNQDMAGCDGYNVEIALDWAWQIITAKSKHTSIDRVKLYKGTQNCIYHFVNNTSVKRNVSPKAFRYDVSGVVAQNIPSLNA